MVIRLRGFPKFKKLGRPQLLWLRMRTDPGTLIGSGFGVFGSLGREEGVCAADQKCKGGSLVPVSAGRLGTCAFRYLLRPCGYPEIKLRTQDTSVLMATPP